MSAAPTLNGCARPRRITNPEHAEYCVKRGIPLDYAEAAGFQSGDGVVVSKMLGYDKPCASGGLVMPYAGTCPPYARVRMDKGDKKYLCPKGQPVPIYKPPPYDAPCPADLKDVRLVVEGPAKALAMRANGLDAIALGGVATCLRGDELHPSWGDVRGQDIRILFDENRVSNKMVAAAEARLASALERAGARVRICKLPQWTDDGRAGPDDYVVAHGPDALYDVVRNATFASPWRQLVTPATKDTFTTVPPVRRWLLRDCRTGSGALTLGIVGQLVGAGGVSKTMAFLQLAICLSTGTRWLGAFDVAPEGMGRTLLMLGEEDRAEFDRRLYYACKEMGAPMPEDDMIVGLPLKGCPAHLVEKDRNGNPTDSAFLKFLQEYVPTIPDLRLIVADPFSRFGGQDAEKDNFLATRSIQAFESLSVLTGATTLFGHHSAQWARTAPPTSVDAQGTAGRGVTAINDGGRWTMNVRSEKVAGLDEESSRRLGKLVTFSWGKSNYSADWEPVSCRRVTEGVLLPLDEMDRELVAAARQDSAPEARREDARKQSRQRDVADALDVVLRVVADRPGINWSSLMDHVMADGVRERVARSAIAAAEARLDPQPGPKRSKLYYPRSADK